MEVLTAQRWSWTLYQSAGTLYLSVVCGTVGLFTLDFELNDVEREAFEMDGERPLSQLAARARQDPEAFRERHISGFTQRTEVLAAVDDWRRRFPRW